MFRRVFISNIPAFLMAGYIILLLALEIELLNTNTYTYAWGDILYLIPRYLFMLGFIFAFFCKKKYLVFNKIYHIIVVGYFIIPLVFLITDIQQLNENAFEILFLVINAILFFMIRNELNFNSTTKIVITLSLSVLLFIQVYHNIYITLKISEFNDLLFYRTFTSDAFYALPPLLELLLRQNIKQPTNKTEHLSK